MPQNCIIGKLDFGGMLRKAPLQVLLELRTSSKTLVNYVQQVSTRLSA